MRGPGEFLGQRQHGLSELAAAKLAGDMTALNNARAAADALVAENSVEGAPLLGPGAGAARFARRGDRAELSLTRSVFRHSASKLVGTKETVNF